MERRCGPRGRAPRRRIRSTFAIVGLAGLAVVAAPATATATATASAAPAAELVAGVAAEVATGVVAGVATEARGSSATGTAAPSNDGPVPGSIPVSTALRLPASTSLPLPLPSLPPAPLLPLPSPPVPLSPPPPAPPPPPPEPPLLGQFRDYLSSRSGHVSVAVYDMIADTVVSYTDPAVAGYENASTVKLAILTALVERAGPAGVLPPGERRSVTPMISVSDNAAASRLWASLGSAAGMRGFYDRLGMADTTAGPGGRWGLTRTTAADQLKLLREIAYPGELLSEAGRATVAGFLRGVIASQRWGLTGGVPDHVAVELKNGWLPYDGGWVVNSIGHVYGDGRDYVMAVYTRDSPSMAVGIDTVEGLSALAWQAARTR